jgi:amidase
MAVGTETNGSITCPASISGIVGFKPTVGLVSRTHVIPISHSQDTPGPMTRTVREAAAMLTAMAGSDPADAATREADARKTDYVTALSDNSLRGRRIGVMRFATGFGTDAAFAEALETLRREGAILVDIDKFEGRGQIGSESYKVLLSEFKADLNAYLATTPPTVRTRTLADLIAFNSANASAEMPLFGQDIFEGSEKTKGLDDPEYKKARETSFRMAGPEGIDKMLRDSKVVALVGPTMPAAWLIDSVHGDQISGGGAGSLAAVAGYPHLTVPMGDVKGLPIGLSFIGPKWSDALILSLGYDYEQASRKRLDPRFVRSIEERDDVERAFTPAAR